MALNAGDVSQEVLQDSSDGTKEGFVAGMIEGIRTHAKTAILAL
jgi:hypothetical protein